ncbi:MAG TPA: fused MFS/spermidine synthase, partial [Vicinamibacteria bacterium]
MIALPFLFFASGALGLTYEVLWMRRLTLLFGATPLATTATLSGFFLGLAAGSRVFGARAARWRRPLVAFGALEAGVALGALLFEPVLGLYGRAYPLLQSALAPHPAAFAAAKLVLAMAAVGLPAFCMGGTLPALGEAVASGPRGLGIPVGRLYAINLAGAALGTLAVPFVLLPRLGSAGSYGAAVAGSLAVGLGAWLAGSRTERAAAAAPAERRAPPRAHAPGHRIGTGVVLALAGLSGLLTLALQVLWTRMSALVHENSLYSFAIVVFVFLLGLAGGAALARAALRRAWPAARLLALTWLAAGVLVTLSPRVFHALTGGLAFLAGEGWRASLLQLLAIASATMLPATLALGMALPLLMELAGGGEDSAGPVLGRLLAANTLGAILGPLLATFLLGPQLGLWRALAALGAMAVAAGAYAGLTRAEGIAAAAGLASLWLVLPPGTLPAVRVRSELGERLVSVREGSHGTTAVVADAHDRWITVNNSYVLGGTAAAAEERFQAHLPLLLHPAPRRVAFLGMGTGITAGAALQHPVEEVVALEIVPEVAAAARADFADVNGRFLEDPRVRVVTDDGRHYLAAPPHRFEVIVGDLLVPWRAGEAPLYSREHFEAVRR